jgi:hypothetical protein
MSSHEAEVLDQNPLPSARHAPEKRVIAVTKAFMTVARKF